MWSTSSRNRIPSWLLEKIESTTRNTSHKKYHLSWIFSLLPYISNQMAFLSLCTRIVKQMNGTNKLNDWNPVDLVIVDGAVFLHLFVSYAVIDWIWQQLRICIDYGSTISNSVHHWLDKHKNLLYYYAKLFILLSLAASHHIAFISIAWQMYGLSTRWP